MKEIIRKWTIEPTFVTRVRQEVLDITFGTPTTRLILHKWKVAADHRIITLELGRLAGRERF